MVLLRAKTVLITGCSDGSLGSALCVAFHEAGWRVFATARNTSKLGKARELGIETLPLDTLSEESVRACVEQVSRLTGTETTKSGSLDMLVNNAGGGYCMPVLDIDLAEARKLFELNVLSLITTTKHFLPLLRRSAHGAIVANNTSCSGMPLTALPFEGAYNATKAAAVSLTENMRMELAPFNVRVINLVTGSVRSTFFTNVSAPPVLPTNSPYALAKDIVEKAMSGASNQEEGMPQDQWAKKVVTSLSKSQPSLWIWAGAWASVVWMFSFLWVGFADFVRVPRVGLDVIAKRVKEQEGRTQ